MVSGTEPFRLFDDLLFPKVFQAFRLSIQPTKLIIAFLAVAVICLAGWVMDFSQTVVTDQRGQTTELSTYMKYVDNPEAAIKSLLDKFEDKGRRRGVFSILWHFTSDKFHASLGELFELNLTSVAKNIEDCFKAVGWAIRYHYVYCLIFVLITLAVISIAGGSLCRIAALQFAQGEKPGLTEAVHFSTRRFVSLFTAPLAPIGIIVFIGLFILLLGLAGNIPWAGELIVGLGMPLALLAGALITVISIGAVVGFGLMFPAVAYDGSDSFDSISRSFSYVYARPWQMGFYCAIAAVYGSICYVFVRFFAFLLLCITRYFLQFGVWVDSRSAGVDKLSAIWPAPKFMDLLGSSQNLELPWTESLAAFLIRLFLLVVLGLVVSFIISFYFSANTIIYSLMRNRVDNTALEDICTHFDEAEVEPLKTEPEPQKEKPSSKSKSQPKKSSSKK
ncbi:MAG: hypothetical protein CEE38_21420 [Planctomycetes bacterium B3_Pla]|nr:MAG: hypothetical protein CEE38_21420 [Planctomycetes bacterium B3_Pla]